MLPVLAATVTVDSSCLACALRKARREVPVVTLATAHPAKFRDAVERATGQRPSLPSRVGDLFERYLATPAEMPPGWRAAMPVAGPAERVAHVGDFVAGMTDRFAIAEHRRLFDATPDLR